MKTTLLPQLQTFILAARRKSFSAAARELGVSDVPGFFLYFPSRAQSSAPLRLFIEVAKEFVTKAH